MISSYQTFSYLNYPLEEVLTRLAGHGYQGVEISAGSELGNCYPQYFDEDRVKAVVAQAKSLGLQIVSYDCELLPASGWNLASDRPEVRRRTVKYIQSAVAKAAELGAKCVVVVAGRCTYGVEMKQARAWAAQGFRKCARFAAEQGVTLGLEHLTLLEGNVVVTLDDLLAMLERVDSPGLAALLDTGHVPVNGESLTDYVYRLGEKIVHIHLDDNDGKSDDHLPPGMGTINFGPMFAALKRIGYQGAISVEPSFGFSTDPDAAALQGIEFLKQYL